MLKIGTTITSGDVHFFIKNNKEERKFVSLHWKIRRAIVRTPNKNNVILDVLSLHATYQIRHVWGRARTIARYSCPGLMYLN